MPRTSNHTSGGYCVGVPPLPIPNREVKPDCADGTAIQCGRVGGRLFSTNPRKEIFPHGGFCVYRYQVWTQKKATFYVMIGMNEEVIVDSVCFQFITPSTFIL